MAKGLVIRSPNHVPVRLRQILANSKSIQKLCYKELNTRMRFLEAWYPGLQIPLELAIAFVEYLLAIVLDFPGTAGGGGTLEEMAK